MQKSPKIINPVISPKQWTTTPEFSITLWSFRITVISLVISAIGVAGAFMTIVETFRMKTDDTIYSMNTSQVDFLNQNLSKSGTGSITVGDNTISMFLSDIDKSMDITYIVCGPLYHTYPDKSACTVGFIQKLWLEKNIVKQIEMIQNMTSMNQTLQLNNNGERYFEKVQEVDKIYGIFLFITIVLSIIFLWLAFIPGAINKP